MAPKKKQEEIPPPQPEELLPDGYSIGGEVFWGGCPERLGETSTFMVRPGCTGRLVGVPDMIEFEKEGGEKGYSVEVALITFDGQTEPHKVPLTSLLLQPPARDAIWNVKPLMRSKYVKLLAPVTTLNKSATSTGPRSQRQRSASPSARSPPTQETDEAGNPFINALAVLEGYPHRTDKVEHILKPSLVEFLNNTDFHYSSNSLGNHFEQGWLDWRAIYPWVEGVLKEANIRGDLSPELTMDASVYESLVKRFDKRAGGFINECPKTENILPFGKFVVTRLYLEAQQEIRKRLELEAQMKELVEREGELDGSPRFAALWDTDDELDMRVCLPEDFGEINFRQQFVANGGDTQPCSDVEEGQTMLTQAMVNISWPVFDSQATGEDALLCPPVGEYSVRLHMAARRSKLPCHWACQIVVAGESQVFGGTWHDGDDVSIQIATVVFSEPTADS